MSIKIMTQVWDRCPEKAEPLIVMLALADWCNDAGECWPAIPALASKARITDRAVFKIINRLEASGEIEITVGGGRGNRSGYRLPRYVSAESMVGSHSAQTPPRQKTNPEHRTGFQSPQTLNTETINPERGDTETLNAATPHIEEPLLGTVMEPSVSAGASQPAVSAGTDLPAVSVNGSGPTTRPRSARNGKAPQPPEYHALIAALAEVCRLDLATIPQSTRVKLDGAAKSLLGAGVTADFVQEVGTRWYSSDWRGKQGKKPTLAQLQEEIGDARLQTTRAPGHYPRYGVHDAPARVKMSEVF